MLHAHLLLPEDKWENSGRLPKSNALSEIGEHWIGNHFHVFFRFWTVKMFSEVYIATGNIYRLLWNSVSPENSRHAIVIKTSSINSILNTLFFEPMYVFRYHPLSYAVITFLQTLQSISYNHLLFMYCGSFLLRCLKTHTLQRRIRDERWVVNWVWRWRY
jgi:hypothetical protein